MDGRAADAFMKDFDNELEFRAEVAEVEVALAGALPHACASSLMGPALWSTALRRDQTQMPMPFGGASLSLRQGMRLRMSMRLP